MIKFLIKTIVSLIILFVIIIVPYNLYFGSDEEKQRSNEIIGQAKDLVGSVVGLLDHEKEQYGKGKYDEAVSDLKQALGMIHQQANKLIGENPDLVKSVTDLETRELELEKVLEQVKAARDSGATESDEALKVFSDLLNGLNKDTQDLANEVGKYSQGN